MSIFDRLTFNELDEIYISLTSTITESMADAGDYHNHRHNSRKNMIDSYKAMLDCHPKFQRLFGNDEDGNFIPTTIDIIAVPAYKNER